MISSTNPSFSLYSSCILLCIKKGTFSRRLWKNHPESPELALASFRWAVGKQFFGLEAKEPLILTGGFFK